MLRNSLLCHYKSILETPEPPKIYLLAFRPSGAVRRRGELEDNPKHLVVVGTNDSSSIQDKRDNPKATREFTDITVEVDRIKRVVPAFHPVVGSVFFIQVQARKLPLLVLYLFERRCARTRKFHDL